MKIKDIVAQALVHLQTQMSKGNYLESCTAVAAVLDQFYMFCPAVAAWAAYCDQGGANEPAWWGNGACTAEYYRDRVNMLKEWARDHGEEEI